MTQPVSEAPMNADAAARPSVGLVGWRGMVGSVLMQRMVEENDFTKINPVFFSTSNAGGPVPELAGVDTSETLQDAHDSDHPGWRLHHRGLPETSCCRLERHLDRCSINTAHGRRVHHRP